MIKIGNLKADFQLVSTRVVKFELETKKEESDEIEVELKCDYDIGEIEENNEIYMGTVQFKVAFEGKKKNKKLFKIHIVYEGCFAGKKEKLGLEDFKNMLELNGIITLTHLTRSYIMSCTALAGFNPPLKLPLINVHKLREMKHKTM